MARLLFVHAHPDDESLWTGVAMAHHVARGDEVHVLTCTLGEEGEVIPDDLKHLELPAGEPRDAGAPDPLAHVRRDELRQAMAQMGVTSSVVLGDDAFRALAGRPEAQTYRDSGMVGTPSAEHPRAFAASSIDAVATDIAAYLDALAPDVVVTYDEQGGYGHPDHIRTHEVTVAAVARSRTRPRLFIALTPRSWAAEDRAWLHATCSSEFLHESEFTVPDHDAPYPPSVVDDAEVTHAVVDENAVTAQIRALREHRTQVTVVGEVYALSNNVAARLSGREGYTLFDATHSTRVPASDRAALAHGQRDGLVTP